MLLVECHETLRSGLHAWLRQEFPSCQIDAAASRGQAEWLAKAHPPTVVLVDIDARQGEGFASLRSLRALLPTVPLVALSLYQVDYLREPAIHAGAVACVGIALADDSLRDLLRDLLPTDPTK